MRNARHDAFITYTQRNSRDWSQAKAVQHGLHRLAKPFYRLRAMNVFRDETSLAQTNKIGESIREHLQRSDYLLVIASPTSAASEWVRAETQQWVQMGRLDCLIIIHVDGHLRWDVDARRFDPATACLTPAVLDADWTDQPFIIDMCGISRDELLLRNPAFAMAMAKIAARIRGIEPYLLTSEDVTQHRRTMFAAWGAGLSILVLAGVVSVLYVAEQSSRRNAELRLADSFVFQSREYAARRQWQSASEVLGRAWDGYASLNRSPLLAEFATWLIDRERRSPSAQIQYKGRRFSAAAFDCASRTLLAGDQSGGLVAWRPDRSAAVDAVDKHTGRVSELRAVSAGVFSAGHDGRLLQWDLTVNPPTARELHRLQGKSVSSMDATDDGSRFVFGTADGLLVEFDKRSGKSIAWPAHAGDVSAVRINADASRIVSTSRDNTAATWKRNGSKWSLAYPPIKQRGPLRDVALLVEMDWAFLANANGSVAVINIESGAQARAPNALTEGAMSVAVRGDFGVTGDFAGTLHLWDVATGAPVAELVAHRGAVLTMSFACTDQLLVTAGTDGLLAAWSMSNAAVVAGPRVDAKSRIVLSPTGDRAIVIVPDGKIEQFDLPTWRRTETGVSAGGSVSAASLSPDGTTLAIGRADGEVHIFDWRTGRLALRSISRASSKAIQALAVSDAARLTAWLDGTAQVMAWASGGDPVRRPFPNAVRVDVAPTHDSVLVGTKDGTVVALDAATLKTEHALLKHDAGIGAVRYLSKPSRILAGDEAGMVKVRTIKWGDAEGEPILLRPPDRVGSADAFGQVIAVTQADGGRLVIAVTSGFRIGVWELDYQRNLFARPETIYPGFNTALSSASISKDGRTILALTVDGHLLSLILPARATSSGHSASQRDAGS